MEIIDAQIQYISVEILVFTHIASAVMGLKPIIVALKKEKRNYLVNRIKPEVGNRQWKKCRQVFCGAEVGIGSQAGKYTN